VRTELELEDVAAVAARLHRGEPEDRVLGELDIDPRAWPGARDDWLQRIARQAEAGNLALAQRYVALHAAATAALNARPNAAPVTTRKALSAAASQATSLRSGGDRVFSQGLLDAPSTPPSQPAPEPTLSLYEYAMLRAEIAYTSGDEARVWHKYGLSTQDQQEAELTAWERKIQRSPEIGREYRGLHADAQRHWSRLSRK
jgi:hypothetical protein